LEKYFSEYFVSNTCNFCSYFRGTTHTYTKWLAKILFCVSQINGVTFWKWIMSIPEFIPGGGWKFLSSPPSSERLWGPPSLL
jgi:hypothetical protein